MKHEALNSEEKSRLVVVGWDVRQAKEKGYPIKDDVLIEYYELMNRYQIYNKK